MFANRTGPDACDKKLIVDVNPNPVTSCTLVFALIFNYREIHAQSLNEESELGPSSPHHSTAKIKTWTSLICSQIYAKWPPTDWLIPGFLLVSEPLIRLPRLKMLSGTRNQWSNATRLNSKRRVVYIPAWWGCFYERYGVLAVIVPHCNQIVCSGNRSLFFFFLISTL